MISSNFIFFFFPDTFIGVTHISFLLSDTLIGVTPCGSRCCGTGSDPSWGRHQSKRPHSQHLSKSLFNMSNSLFCFPIRLSGLLPAVVIRRGGGINQKGHTPFGRVGGRIEKGSYESFAFNVPFSILPPVLRTWPF